MKKHARSAMRIPMGQLHQVVASAVAAVSAMKHADEDPASASGLATLSEEELDQVAAGVALDAALIKTPVVQPILKGPVIAGNIPVLQQLL